MPADGWVAVTPVDDEIMPLWLASYGFGNRRVERRLTTITKGAPQVRIVILTKTHIELASTSHSNAVA